MNTESSGIMMRDRFIVSAIAFLSGAIAAQGFALIAGLLIVRWLSVEDYAIYTALTTMLGAISILTKGGIHLGFTAIVGRTWPDRSRVAQTVSAALAERKLLSILTLPPLLAVTAWLLIRNGASVPVTFVLVFLVIAVWLTELHTKIVEQILFFADGANKVQRLDTQLAGIRLVGVCVSKLALLVDPICVMTITVMTAVFRTASISRWIKKEIVLDALPNLCDRREIRSIAIRQFPLELFYVMQSQLVFIILGWFGVPSQTATIGALGRIGQLLVPMQAFIFGFAIPDFARAKSNIARRFAWWTIINAVPGVILLMLAWVMPDTLLLLVGPNYRDMQAELLASVVGVAGMSVTGIALQLLTHRGLNYFSWVQVPVVLIWIAAAPLFLDLRTTTGVLWLQAGFALGPGGAVVFEFISALLLGWRISVPSSSKH